MAQRIFRYIIDKKRRKMKLLINKVRKWGRDKGINNAYAQFGKVVEELGETIS